MTLIDLLDRYIAQSNARANKEKDHDTFLFLQGGIAALTSFRDLIVNGWPDTVLSAIDETASQRAEQRKKQSWLINLLWSVSDAIKRLRRKNGKTNHR